MPRVLKIAKVGINKHRGTCSHGLICCPHSVTGDLVSGSAFTSFGTAPVAGVGDKVTHNCPHCGTGYVAESSMQIPINGVRASAIGDKVIYPGGSGVII